MNIVPTEIPDVLLIEPEIYKDRRGFFLETFNMERYASIGVATPFVQDNHSGSQKGTLRGLHYQVRHTQGKLVQVVVGEIFDVAVDLRQSSPTFGKWTGRNLNAKDHLQMWVPEGCAHGFLVLSEWAEIYYKVTDYYAPEDERSLLWSDETLEIIWPLAHGEEPLISGRDAKGTPFHAADYFP